MLTQGVVKKQAATCHLGLYIYTCAGVELIQQPVFREFAADAQVHFGLGAPPG